MRKKRLILFVLVGLVVLGVLVIFICNRIIENVSRGKLYSDAASIPYNRTGLLLGTTRHVVNGG
ncbi:MAG TPA: vancomycin high temperature exclusion protein, partial [Flavisolibacter sp.]